MGDGKGYYVNLSGIVPAASLDGQAIGIAIDDGAVLNVQLAVRRSESIVEQQARRVTQGM